MSCGPVSAEYGREIFFKHSQQMAEFYKKNKKTDLAAEDKILALYRDAAQELKKILITTVPDSTNERTLLKEFRTNLLPHVQQELGLFDDYSQQCVAAFLTAKVKKDLSHFANKKELPTLQKFFDKIRNGSVKSSKEKQNKIQRKVLAAARAQQEQILKTLVDDFTQLEQEVQKTLDAVPQRDLVLEAQWLQRLRTIMDAVTKIDDQYPLLTDIITDPFWSSLLFPESPAKLPTPKPPAPKRAAPKLPAAPPQNSAPLQPQPALPPPPPISPLIPQQPPQQVVLPILPPPSPPLATPPLLTTSPSQPPSSQPASLRGRVTCCSRFCSWFFSCLKAIKVGLKHLFK